MFESGSATAHLKASLRQTTLLDSTPCHTTRGATSHSTLHHTAVNFAPCDVITQLRPLFHAKLSSLVLFFARDTTRCLTTLHPARLPTTPHTATRLLTICFCLPTAVRRQELRIYTDYKQDESYTPQRMSVRVGTTFHDLKVWCWVT